MRTPFLILLLTVFLIPATLAAQTQTGDSNTQTNRQDNHDKESMQQRGKRGQKGQRGEQGQRRDQGQRAQKQRQPDPAKMFKRFDQNQDGVIVAEEIPERIRARMERADTNGDGNIDEKEFKAHVAKASAKRGQGKRGQGKMQPGAQQANGKGKGKMGQRQKNDRPDLSLRDPEKMDADQVMSKLDRDGNGSLEKSELPRMMVTRMQKVDSDGDEVVSITELRSAIEQLKAKAMDSGKGRYSTDSKNSKGQIPKRPGSGNGSNG